MQDPKKNVVFVLPTLAAGGAERVISFVAQNLNSEKYNSTLLITGFEKDAAFSVENIHVKYLEKKRVFSAIFKLIVFLKKHKPDVFLSPDGFLPFNTSVRTLNVIHDVGFEHHKENLPFLERMYYRKYFSTFARKSTRLATISQFSKADIIKTYGLGICLKNRALLSSV